MTAPVSDFAPAKVNLCLHVTGRRADGYHLLDSLVVFVGVGDRVTVAEGSGLSLDISGPEAASLAAEPDNLVLRAAQAMGITDAALGLWKVLPLSSGVGGGSADAAATLRALSCWSGRMLPSAGQVLALGADVPVCMAGQPARMRGVGEDLSPLPALPPIWLVLVNPRVPVATPQIFAALTRRDFPPVPDLPRLALHSAVALAGWLSDQTRNDLVAPALQVVPLLSGVQAALAATPGCLLARMSGSGGTHFGIFATEAAARAAEQALRRAHPGWWISAAPVLLADAEPQTVNN
jgi:4-diphosphocytidyl-2-C-methyl-D-erythritol kinase